ncbi:MAG: AmmeMemoRadiSam system protein B, partial [Mailhella sp.]|nr:AmmeMemoRadiSam system protein B [Mailhella sp.]
MRKPHIAGTWYPDDAGKLEHIFSPWVERPPRDMRPSALILPHAGYAYSGDIAAEACSHADPSAYRRIIILAPSHRMAFPGKVSVEPAGEVETPFGPAEFSRELHERLLTLPCATHISEAHPAEHSIAIQLPLLKRFFPQCVFGGLLVGDLIRAGDAAEKQRGALAQALHDLFDEETLVVVSSDFTHYGKSFGYVPFTEQIPRNMQDLDRRAWEAFAANSPDIFADFMRRTRTTVCGASCMLLLLEALPEQARFTRIDYANSGMKTGDFDHCVGYTAGAVETDWSLPRKNAASDPGSAPISYQTGRLLPMLARRQLRRQFGLPCNELLPHVDAGMLIELQRRRATFVTLSIKGRLRGCIGDILPQRP